MDKKEALKFIQEHGMALEEADFKPGQLNNKDKEIILAAVIERGSNFQYADDSLKKDPDILAIVNKDK